MLKNYFLFSVVSGSLLFTSAAFSQEEDPSCMPPPKKAQKYIDAGDAAKTPQEASENYQKAIDAAPDNAACYFAFGKYAYDMGMEYFKTQPNPDLGERSFAKAEVMLKNAVEYCDDYNSEMLYLLGVINYSQSEMEDATRWFEKFVAYKHSDNSRYGENYAKQLADVKEVLGELKDEQEMLSTTVPFNPKMVPNVSSREWDEYFPMISPDNEMMFFTRKVDRKNLGDMVSNWKEEFTIAKRNGAVGCICDSMIRDCRRIMEMEFPIFCGGIRPLDSLGRGRVMAYDVPVRCGDVIVKPGELIFSDFDGVVVIPNEVEDKVLELAHEKVFKENESRRDLLNGDSLRVVYDRYGVL